MKSRRNFFALLSALPLVGALFGASAASEPLKQTALVRLINDRRMACERAKDLLLPGLRGKFTSAVHSNIYVDFTGLVIVAMDTSGDRPMAAVRVITVGQIEDGTFKSLFMSYMAEMANELRERGQLV